MMKKLTLLIAMIALGLATNGCSRSQTENVNQNANTSQTVQSGDATITTTSPPTAPGYKVEEKTFPTGEVVTRVTRPNSKTEVFVHQKGNESKTTVPITDQNQIERAMEMTVEEVRDVISKAPGAVQEAGKVAGDKAEDAGQTVKEKAKEGAGEVKDAAEDAASAAGKGAKKAGKAVKKLGDRIRN